MHKNLRFQHKRLFANVIRMYYLPVMFFELDRIAKVPSSRPSTGLSASSIASDDRLIIAARTATRICILINSYEYADAPESCMIRQLRTHNALPLETIAVCV